ncbi:MAG: PKD domain-containing protein [bacterium]
MYFKSSQSPQFQKITNQGVVSLISGGIVLTEIPTIIKLQVNQISPNIPTAIKKVLIDGKAIISLDGNTFEFTIDDNANHEVTLVVEDVPSGAKTEIKIPIQVNRADIIGKLIVTPDTVGTDPFTVKFDASTTIINDTGDELVAFTWDFGDGTGSIKKDFSEAIISHTYRYDTKNNNGSYHPIVTIKTKKGREITVSPENDIIVKRASQKLNITIPDYPAQVANVGDRVGFSIEFNGLPSEITRDFGDGKTMTCNTRQECASTIHVYPQAGTYLIRSSVVYKDKPTIDGTITIKIK